MQKFMDDTFMLYNETGRRLYESCREIPIFECKGNIRKQKAF